MNENTNFMQYKTLTLQPKKFRNQIRLDSNLLKFYDSEEHSKRILIKELEASILSKVHEKIVYKTPFSWIDHLFLTLNNRYKFLKLPVKYKTETIIVEDLYPNIPVQNNQPIRICYIDSLPAFPSFYD